MASEAELDASYRRLASGDDSDVQRFADLKAAHDYLRSYTLGQRPIAGRLGKDYRRHRYDLTRMAAEAAVLLRIEGVDKSPSPGYTGSDHKTQGPPPKSGQGNLSIILRLSSQVAKSYSGGFIRFVRSGRP